LPPVDDDSIRTVDLHCERTGRVHELAIAESMVDAIRARIGSRRVRRVQVDVGRLSCVEPEAIRFCFDLCARGTTVEGASLEINDVPGRGRCSECGAADLELTGPLPLCRCGSACVEILDGTQLRIRAVEVA
jgi:hydrogenase nickel incorporation protein HypA/HybF